MRYFQARSNLNFLIKFNNAVLKLWKMEGEASKNIEYTPLMSPLDYQAAIHSEASKIKGYQEVRERVAKGVLRAERIAKRFGVPIIIESYPAPSVGGPVIRQKIFSAILSDTSHGGIDHQAIYDALNQTIGECESEIRTEFRHLINPFYWIKELIILIIRIPFLLIRASGFDISKVEDHFLARVFKLFEIIFILYILLRLGIEKESVQQILLKLF